MDVKKDILWRVYLCFLGIIVLGVFVIGRAFYIQNVQGSYWKSMSDSLHLKYVPLNAERGSIYSEDGNMLSTSIPVFDIYIDFGAAGLREKKGKRFYENIDSLSISLSGLFNDQTAEEYKKQLTVSYQNEDRYFLLKRKISFEQYKQLRDFVLVREGRNKSGFITEIRDSRVNPYVLLANRTIGLSRGDTSKNVGLERTYDSLLKGQTGQRPEDPRALVLSEIGNQPEDRGQRAVDHGAVDEDIDVEHVVAQDCDRQGERDGQQHQSQRVEADDGMAQDAGWKDPQHEVAAA